jgi:uncharacterized membrane protein HdeD (DUF308 family)
MFVAPGTTPGFGQKLTRDIAERVARNWWVLLLNGALLIVTGLLIFSIDWTIRSLATFIGVVFIVQGIFEATTPGFDARAQRVSALAGLLSAAAGVAIIVWPAPGLVAVGIFLGAWLIVMGTFAITAAFAARRMLPDWWLVLILGLLEVPLGVLAVADPGATLAAIITVGGIWAVAIGVMRIVLAFQIKRLPEELDRAWAGPAHEGASGTATSAPSQFAATG